MHFVVRLGAGTRVIAETARAESPKENENAICACENILIKPHTTVRVTQDTALGHTDRQSLPYEQDLRRLVTIRLPWDTTRARGAVLML
jgi:hypothetical protein